MTIIDTVSPLGLSTNKKTLADFTYDGVIIALWRIGRRDTLDIARAMKVHESVVANRLARLRDAGALA